MSLRYDSASRFPSAWRIASRLASWAWLCVGAILLPACWAPPFDAALSTSVRFEGKLERVALLGFVDYSGIESGEDYFVPAYEETPTDGFWVRRSADTRLSIRYVGQATEGAFIGNTLWCEPNYWEDLNAVQSMSSISSLSDLSTALARAVHVWGTGSVGTGSADAMLGSGLDADYSWGTRISATSSGFSIAMLPIGGSAQAFDDGSDAGIYRNLLMSGGSGGSCLLSVSGRHRQSHAASYTSENPAIVDNALYYEGPSLAPGAFFLEYLDGASTYDIVVGETEDGSAVVGFRWDASDRGAAPESLPFDVKVTDALHDNRLLARGGISTECYDVDGGFLFSLPTGAIRFVFEYEVASTFYCYFTRTVVIPARRDGGSGSIRFEVFRCPTSDLAGLAG